MVSLTHCKIFPLVAIVIEQTEPGLLGDNLPMFYHGQSISVVGRQINTELTLIALAHTYVWGLVFLYLKPRNNHKEET